MPHSSIFAVFAIIPFRNAKKNEQDIIAYILLTPNFLLVCSNDFSAIVVTALGANTMGHLRLMTLRARNEAGSRKLPIRATRITASL